MSIHTDLQLKIDTRAPGAILDGRHGDSTRADTPAARRLADKRPQAARLEGMQTMLDRRPRAGATRALDRSLNAPADAPVQRKIGAEIEVSQSVVELDQDEEAQGLSQGQTLATLPAGGKRADLKAEGPDERVALAEFVTEPYGEEAVDGFLGAIKTLAEQAMSITPGPLPVAWTVQGGDQVKVVAWPESAQGGFQFTVSPVDFTTPQLFNAFQPTSVFSFSSAEGFTREAPEDPDLASAISTLRVRIAKAATQAFWTSFVDSGLSLKASGRKAPPAVQNLIIALTEAATWRLGLLLFDIRSTLKNAQALLPKFSFTEMINTLLERYVEDEKLPEAKKLLGRALVEALLKESLTVKTLADEKAGVFIGFARKEIEFIDDNLKTFDEVEQAKREGTFEGHFGLNFALSMALSKGSREAQEKMRALQLRQIEDLKSLSKSGLVTSAQDALDVISGTKPFLGNIEDEDPESVLQDEGSLIALDENAPEGAFEVRNPFNAQVPADKWVEASEAFIENLMIRGVRF